MEAWHFLDEGRTPLELAPVLYTTEVHFYGFIGNPEADGYTEIFEDVLGEWKGGDPEGSAKLEVLSDARSVCGECVRGEGPGEQ